MGNMGKLMRGCHIWDFSLPPVATFFLSLKLIRYSYSNEKLPEFHLCFNLFRLFPPRELTSPRVERQWQKIYETTLMVSMELCED